MVIGIDIDDTISDTYEVAFAYAQSYTINCLNKSAKISEKSSFHHSYIKDLHDWSEKEERDFWSENFVKIIDEVKPYTLAPEIIRKLKDDGNKIVIITARWPEEKFDVIDVTKKWLNRNNIVYDDIVFDSKNKAQDALDKKIDIFIDDSFKNCCDVSEAGIKTYMLETRTNKGLDNDNIIRVYSWPDIYDKIKKEEN